MKEGARNRVDSACDAEHIEVRLEKIEEVGGDL
jgi:hypothetical protein